MSVPTIRPCGLCGNPRQARPIVTDGKTVDLAVCNICDKRRCEKCKHVVQDIYAKKCPGCGHRLGGGSR